jgi:OmpA-OmpF porin, OOP family
MRASIILTQLFFISSNVIGQNLVSNPGFENFSVCPGSFTQKNEFNIPGWSSPTIGTPDHFHSCSNGDADVPYNWAGVAEPYEGDGYVGLFLWMREKEYREYLQCKLTQPLMKDSLYHLQFVYKLSSYSKYATDRIGMACTDKPVRTPHDRPIELVPALTVIHDSALTKETGLWEKASMVYKANGDEQYIVIGNFWTNDETKTYHIEFRPISEQMLSAASYYYIDDVQVISDFDLRQRKKLQGIPELEFVDVSPNQTYILKNILFAHDSYRLLNPSFAELDRLAEYLLKHSRLKVQLFGHTDDQGTAQYNLKLSDRRARNVRDYLTSLGISHDRIESFGMGKSKPLVDDVTEEARQINRRVEIRFFE